MTRSKFLGLFLVASLLSLLMPMAIALAHSEGGTVVIRDGSNPSDTATITLTKVSALAEGESYQGWFVSSDGATRVSAGVMTLSDDGGAVQTFVSDVNIINTYSTFEVTKQPSGEAVYKDSISQDSLVIIKAANDGAAGLKSQISAASGHADTAVVSTTLVDVQTNAQKIVDALDGTSGAIAHAGNVSSAGSDAAKSSDVNISGNSQALINAAGNANNWATQARDLALNATTTGNHMAASLFVQSARATLSHAQDESNAAYLAAQDLAGYELEIVEAAPPSTGDPMVPTLALWVLIIGFGLFASGGFIFARNKIRA